MAIENRFASEIRHLGQFTAPFDKEGDTEKLELAALIDFIGPYPSIEKLEALVSHYKHELEILQTQTLPVLMDEIGVTEFKLADGRVAKRETVMSTSMKDKDRGLLAEWMEAHEMGHLIKDTLEFDKGEVNEAFIEELRAEGHQFSRKSDVNAAALKAALKRHLDDGGDLPPEEALAVSIGPMVRLK